jgi:hypothetical protein
MEIQTAKPSDVRMSAIGVTADIDQRLLTRWEHNANRGEWMRLVIAALLLTLLTPASAHASCATMQALAQEHANDMARRGSMDHNGFASRARRGARAENVAYGVKTKPQAIALWWGSSGHAANMRLPGCKAVASAVGHNGARYWVMVIGN